MNPIGQNFGNFTAGNGQNIALKGLPFSSLQISQLPPGVLWWIFALFVLITGVMTLVLFYHWIKYGAGIARVGIMGTLYLAGAGVFLAIMFFAAVGYTTSI